jgi:putative Mg2+ transporter-C (MgtC) family protein
MLMILSEVPALAPINDWEVVGRIGVALLVGGILGLEREVRGKAAGLRTYMLVSLGAAFFVLIPIQLDAFRQSADAFSRVMQGIIAGIGFVGGGVILHRSRNHSSDATVKGLTSATAIWVAAALGIAAGCGVWKLALLGAGISLIILRLLKTVEP